MVDLERQQKYRIDRTTIKKAVYHHVLKNVRTRNLRVRFVAASLSDKGLLCLIHPNEYHVPINLRSATDDLRFEPPFRSPKTPYVSFAELPREPEVGYKLSLARWSDGSLIWLDGRGLLHCRSSDATLPEFSLVLAGARAISGWVDSGEVFGDPYFVGTEPDISSNEFFENIYRPFVERLQC